jgi:hypothetical protein
VIIPLAKLQILASSTSELMLEHFGFEFALELNVYKPFYEID